MLYIKDEQQPTLLAHVRFAGAGHIHVNSQHRKRSFQVSNYRQGWCNGNAMTLYPIRIPDGSLDMLTGFDVTPKCLQLSDGSVHRLGHDNIFPNPFQLILHQSPFHSTASNTATDNKTRKYLPIRKQAKKKEVI
jgi:hypothetical protein